MSSIIKNGQTFRGISVFGRGVFTNECGNVTTYAGQHRGGYACGLGVATHSNGSKEYAEHGPEGKCDGCCLVRFAIGITGYGLYECGKQKKYVFAFAEGGSTYNGENCEPDDPRVLALIAQVSPVEVCPAAPAPHPPSSAKQTPSNRPMDQPARFAPAGAREGHGHRGASPRRTPSLVAVRHRPTTGAVQRRTTH